jgi:phytoene dehydrogenase-like protein
LLSDIEEPKKLLRQEKSSSALIFYWGVKNQTPQLGVHNILFSANYREEFEHLFKHRKIYHDPTVYINITSKVENADAPPGCENWFILVNTPNHDTQNWDEWKDQIRESVLKKIQEMLHIDLTPLIETEEVLTPQMIESRTSSFRGSLYGNASNSTFAAFLRHPNFSKQLKGLYFCGGSVHPGGGIPLVLRSAAIVSRDIERRAIV